MGTVSRPNPKARRGTPPTFGVLQALWLRWNTAQPMHVPAREEWPTALRRVRLAGLFLLGANFLALSAWTAVLAQRDALTVDFATFQQAAYLVAHGTLDPYTTMQHFWYWQDHGEFLFWPLAVFQLLSDAPETLEWLQVAFAVGAETFAFLWICDIVAHRTATHESARPPIGPSAASFLAVTGVVLLVADPWVSQAVSFDIHTEPFGALFAVWAARDLHRGRMPWVAVLFGLAAGDVSTTCLAAVGLSGLLSRRQEWRRTGAVAAVSLLWLLILRGIGADHGDVIAQYANLLSPADRHQTVTAAGLATAVVSHPLRPVAAIWANRTNVWSYLSPPGVVGLIWPPVLVPVLLLIAETQLGNGFSAPGFQAVLVLFLLPVGTVTVLSAAWQRLAAVRGNAIASRRIMTACLILTLNALGWAVVWLPQIPKRWLRVSPSAASTLERVRRMIHPEDEVVASNGVMGWFASRRVSYKLPPSSRFSEPIHARHVWLIIAPRQGVELVPSGEADEDIQSLSRQAGVREVTASHGVWAFEWSPSKSVHSWIVTPATTLSAVSATGPAGQVVRSGPVQDWSVSSGQRAGYVVEGDYWREPAGTYAARVRLAVSQTANVELWDSTTSTLLARTTVPDTDGPTTVSLDGTVRTATPSVPYNGFGPWVQKSLVTKGTSLEIRVFSPGGTDRVTVYSLGLTRARGG